jgi:hypothetical protein
MYQVDAQRDWIAQCIRTVRAGRPLVRIPVDEACGSSTPLQAGTAFAEPPNNVHKVDNFGPGDDED